MQLHRADQEPEWQNVNSSDRNNWQSLAHTTSGIVTPGNILTIAGFMIATAGLVAILNDSHWLGFAGLAIGRLFDIADGLAAQATGTKSPLGESLDAGFDKLITALALIVLGVSGLVSWYMLLAIFIPHLVIAALSTAAIARGKRLHPSKYGKLSMALAWVSLVGFVIAAASSLTELLTTLSYAIGITSVILSLVALTGYLKPSRN